MDRKPIKIRVIEKSIKQAKKEIDRLENLIYGTPLSDVIDVRNEFVAEIDRYRADKRETRLKIHEHVKKLDELETREKEAFALHEKQKRNNNKWITRVAELNLELMDLENQLFIEKMIHSRSEVAS